MTKASHTVIADFGCGQHKQPGAELFPRHTMMKKTEADRRRGGKTISKSGKEWTLPAQLGRLKTGQDGKGLLRTLLWCPDDLPRWDRIEK